MNILITILIIIGSIIALFLIIAFLTKREFSVERTVTINKPKDEVFNYLKYLKNQEYYSVWVMRDPNVKLVYKGTDGSIGASSAWESDNKHVGVGEQEVIKMTDGESMEMEIRFIKPFTDTNYAKTSVSTLDEGQTKVSNVFFGTNNFPKNIMNLMMDKMIGKDMQQNLENMKANLEK